MLDGQAQRDLADGRVGLLDEVVDCVPEEVKIYVDGRLLDEIPEELTLRADEDHTLYFKGEGYRPELVVLRTDGADTPKLTPDTLCVKPVLLGMDREIEMEIDPD